MDLHLTGNIIAVTGGAKGIGLGICKVLAAEGAIPVIIGRDEHENVDAVDSIVAAGGTAHSVLADLTDPEACALAVKSIVDRFHKIDGLVNNAGENDGVGLANGSYEKFIASLHKSLVHYYLMVHHALPYLIKSKGAVVNIGSKTAETGQGNTSGYAAANGGRNALTREWAVELLNDGVRVNAVIVAECYTPGYEKWISSVADPVQQLKAIENKIPLGKRMTTAEEIANTVAFLLSDKSSHTTGQLFHIDGGYVHLDRGLT